MDVESHTHTEECFVFLFLAPYARTTRYEEAFFPWKTKEERLASLARLMTKVIPFYSKPLHFLRPWAQWG